MKYIKTKEEKILIVDDNSPMTKSTTNKAADTIEELCDGFSLIIEKLSKDSEKKLKAFEIIKKKRVDCLVLVLSQTYVEYNDMCENEKDKLTKEEYDLLKEELL